MSRWRMKGGRVAAAGLATRGLGSVLVVLALACSGGARDDCPGRVDLGRVGCGHIGPTWDLRVLEGS